MTGIKWIVDENPEEPQRKGVKDLHKSLMPVQPLIIVF